MYEILSKNDKYMVFIHLQENPGNHGKHNLIFDLLKAHNLLLWKWNYCGLFQLWGDLTFTKLRSDTTTISAIPFASETQDAMLYFVFKLCYVCTVLKLTKYGVI